MYWLQGPVGRAGEIRRKRHAGAGSFERGRGGDDPMWADEGMWTYHLDQFGDGLLMFTVYKMVSHWVYGIWFTTLLDSGIFCHGLIPKWFRYKVSAEHVHGNGQGLKKTWHGLSQKKKPTNYWSVCSHDMWNSINVRMSCQAFEASRAWLFHLEDPCLAGPLLLLTPRKSRVRLGHEESIESKVLQCSTTLSASLSLSRWAFEMLGLHQALTAFSCLHLNPSE